MGVTDSTVMHTGISLRVQGFRGQTHFLGIIKQGVLELVDRVARWSRGAWAAQPVLEAQLATHPLCDQSRETCFGLLICEMGILLLAVVLL